MGDSNKQVVGTFEISFRSLFKRQGIFKSLKQLEQGIAQ